MIDIFANYLNKIKDFIKKKIDVISQKKSFSVYF